jgi:hypothetical protein
MRIRIVVVIAFAFFASPTWADSIVANEGW